MVYLDLDQLKSLKPAELKKQRTHYLILGILFLLAGTACFISPLMSSIAITMVMSWLFIFSGIMLILATLYYRNFQSIWSIFLGLLLGLSYIFSGYVFMKNPDLAILSLAFLIGVFFLAAGIVRVMVTLRNKEYPGIGIFLFAGIIEIILALILISGWPNTSIVLISSVLGIQFMFNSIDYFSISSFIKKMVNK